MVPASGSSSSDQDTRLIEALRKKARALGRANLCLSGTAEQEIQQRTVNNSEIAALRRKARQVANNDFKWPGDNVINALIAASDALATTSDRCVDKNIVIRDCRLLIAMVPASDV